MRPLVGIELRGSVVRERTGAAATRLGEPAWGPGSLLRDLELRLGLPAVAESDGARAARWIERVRSTGDREAFYARSFAVDELGTATAIIEWRDALIEAGWSGAEVPRAGERLAALAALERGGVEDDSLGTADQLVRVERALEGSRERIYETIALLDDAALWPRRWQTVFMLLERAGTRIERAEALAQGGARRDTDLGVLQACLRGETMRGSIRGDGSLVFLRSDTAADLAELTAAMIGRLVGPSKTVTVVRCRDREALDPALERHGLAAQGCLGESAWRPAMQILPLALELAFAPRDPFRALELLTLAVGPFAGSVGRRLARAVAKQPGIGGKEWLRQKEEARERLRERYTARELERGATPGDAERIAREGVDARMSVLEAWLEEPGLDPAGAPRAGLVEVVARVRTWLRERMHGGAEHHAPAYALAAALDEALRADSREFLSLEQTRQLVDRFARTAQAEALAVESAGRIDHVDHPGALLSASDSVVVWGFVGGVERRPRRVPWNRVELAALREAGVHFPDPSALLRADSEAWRRVVLGARERLVLAAPRSIRATATTPHPLWDEIRGRLGLDDQAVARVIVEARAILTGVARRIVPLAELAPLPLPEARAVWTVDGALIRSIDRGASTSVTSLEKIAGCPLAWLLEHRADLRAGAAAKVAAGPLLNGALGHRLVEELHRSGAFDEEEDALCERARETLEILLVREGAALLLPGASIERLQLTRQLISAVRDLQRYLRQSGRRIAAVEEEVTTSAAVGPLHGRLDLRLVDEHGRPAILDLKWGASTYTKLLAEGRAVQLAVYVRALAEAHGDRSWEPPAAYFALSRGKLLACDERMAPERAIDGAPLGATLARVEATARAVTYALDRGTVLVAGTRRALPLLEALGIAEADRDRHLAVPPHATCEYCAYDSLCGRKWEAFA